VNGSWLVVASISLLTLLVYLIGVYLVWMPRQCAVLAECFAASGNFPSLVPRSVRAAVFEMRLVGLGLLSAVLFLISELRTPEWVHVVFNTTSAIANPNWMIFPALLAVFAGDVLMFDVAPWVARTLDFWMDHPLVPRKMIPSLHWAVRLAGVAMFLFGAGVFWVWLGTLFA
jgi:hypothetical protein